MKKLCVLLFVLVMAGLILQPISSQVNTQSSNARSQSFVADGGPTPLPPPRAV
jgi:hypothetical protein